MSVFYPTSREAYDSVDYCGRIIFDPSHANCACTYTLVDTRNGLVKKRRTRKQYSARCLDRTVTTPPGFADAYRRYCEAGWPSLSCDVRLGGQALPQILNAALYEMLYATNHAQAMYPGLAHGANECVRAHASEEPQAVYLPKLVSGEWLSTMCLTEPQAGSDAGARQRYCRFVHRCNANHR